MQLVYEINKYLPTYDTVYLQQKVCDSLCTNHNSVQQVAQNMSLTSKKDGGVTLNSAFYGASWTQSYLSNMQLGTQDREQRHRTRNIDGMDFPTYP